MSVLVNKNSKVLIPNQDHKNFTETERIIPEGATMKGEFRNVQGLRRGKPFTYRIFIDKDGIILFQNNITPMRTTEVTLGADSSASATTVNLRPAEMFKTTKTMGLVLGAVAGFAYAKYKKHDMKQSVKFLAIGAIAGFLGGYIVDANRDVVVTQSK
jgi:hypothetical protein